MSHSQPTTSLAAVAASAGTGFLDLPREMRDEIYHYAFTTENDSDEKSIDLYDASPPSKALCQVNKQLYHETHELYNQAFRAYWRTNSFHIRPETFLEFINAWGLKDANINQIKRFKIELQLDDAPWIKHCTRIYTLREDGLSWDALTIDGNRRSYVETVVGMCLGYNQIVARLSGYRGPTPAPLLRGEELVASDAAVRENLRMGAAPSLAEQVKTVLAGAAQGMHWWNADRQWGYELH